ncbi:MAG: M1 family metallopeptidase [Candidatus Eisenbacteria bacterium]|nr:M1 family metallopeptidase [Candidatus Eisenbacteria bacterium]
MASLSRSAMFASLSFAALAPAPSRAEPAAPPARLSHDAEPRAETVQLTLDPVKADYTGQATITLEVKEPTSTLRFHARALTIDSAMLRRAAGAGAIAVRSIVPLPPDQAQVTFAAPLPPGTYTLTLHFHNHYNTRAISLYKVVTGGRSYLFTQFEDTEAREAFPCWDEPEFKIPWQLTLTVPDGDLAVSNTPIERDDREGAMRRVTFARTRPLPSYLIAVAVGAFETVPITGMHMPGRVITVKGASAMAAEAVHMTPGIIASLERYFGRPYPYDKLDLIAAPEFLYGAMENAGAVVFADRRLLINPRSVSPEQRQQLAGVIAHELAHMWFGDLVTMKWWDDLWLNESFASWMATKVMDDVYPENKNGVTSLYGTERALTTDSRASTRAMREKVTGATNLGQTANELTYNKGEAVLTMFEGWLGAEKFRAGVLEYLKAHEWGNAEGSDLWRALGHVSGDDIEGAMASFLDQPGVPIVSVEPAGGSRVRISQRRFLTSGDPLVEASRWRIPVILRYPTPGSSRTLRVWLTSRDTVVDVGAGAPPRWIEPNADASGYYRWHVPQTMLDPLVAARSLFTPRERIDLITNSTALLRADQLFADRYLSLFAQLADDPSPEVTRQAVESIGSLRVAFETPKTASAFASYLRVSFESALERFGLEPGPTEPVGISLMRPSLLRLLGDAGNDTRVVAYAETLSASYRRDPASVPASLVETGLLMGAMRGNRAMFDDYRHRFETTTVPNERPMYLAGLGSFRDPALRKAALEYALQGPLRPQETLMIPGAMGVSVAGAEFRGGGAYPDEIAQWMMDHFSALSAKMPPNFANRILALAAGCSETRAHTLRDFCEDPARKRVGLDVTARRLADAIDECAKLHEREGARIERWLYSQAAEP